MSKPFKQLVQERSRDPAKAVAEVRARLQRWQMLPGHKTVSLDEVSWFATVFALAGVQAVEIAQSQVTKKTEGNVTTVIASDGDRVTDGVVDHHPV